MNRIKLRPLGPLARAADRALLGFMKDLMIMNSTPDEGPMLTHRWNNHKLRPEEIAVLAPSLMATSPGDPNARPLNGLMRHLPIVGWQRYAVIKPVCHDQIWWHPGWHTPGLTGVSLIRQRGFVKALQGPGDTEFFGLDLLGRQIRVELVTQGKLGDGQYPEVPLV